MCLNYICIIRHVRGEDKEKAGEKGIKGGLKLLDELCCYVVGVLFVCYYTDSCSVYFIVIDGINLKPSPPKASAFLLVCIFGAKIEKVLKCVNRNFI